MGRALTPLLQWALHTLSARVAGTPGRHSALPSPGAAHHTRQRPRAGPGFQRWAQAWPPVLRVLLSQPAWLSYSYVTDLCHLG